MFRTFLLLLLLLLWLLSLWLLLLPLRLLLLLPRPLLLLHGGFCSLKYLCSKLTPAPVAVFDAAEIGDEDDDDAGSP